jgi:hypothetical protein
LAGVSKGVDVGIGTAHSVHPPRHSASQNFQNMQFILAKVLFLPCKYCIMAASMQVLPVKMRLKEKALLSNPTKKEVFYYE